MSLKILTRLGLINRWVVHPVSGSWKRPCCLLSSVFTRHAQYWASMGCCCCSLAYFLLKVCWMVLISYTCILHFKYLTHKYMNSLWLDGVAFMLLSRVFIFKVRKWPCRLQVKYQSLASDSSRCKDACVQRFLPVLPSRCTLTDCLLWHIITAQRRGRNKTSEGDDFVLF